MPVGSPPPPRRPRGPILAWAAAAGWVIYFSWAEAQEPPPEPRGPGDGWIPSEGEVVLFLLGGVVLLAAVLAAARGPLRPRVRPLKKGAAAFAGGAGAWMILHVLAFEFGGGMTLSLVESFLLPFLFLGVAAAWPFFLGVDGRRVLSALGLTTARGPLREAAAGLLAYPVCLLLQWLWDVCFLPARAGSEVIGWLASDETWVRTWALGLVLVQTPLVEELAMRGILHRFLRDAAHRLPGAAGGAFAVLGTSLLFAIAHLQGWEAIPQLMIFGIVAGTLREVRGSLIGPVVLHAAAWAHITLDVWAWSG